MSRRPWTDAERDVLRARYATERTDDIARDIGRARSSVYNEAHKLGLFKAAETIARLAAEAIADPSHPGRQHWRQPGTPSWNKGKSYQPGGRCRETQIKPGALPWNTQPVGAEVVREGGVLWRKIANNRCRADWKQVHHIVWEAAGNPPVPKGCVLAFRNGRPDDIRVDNLEVIDRRELMARNTRHRLPKPIADVIALRGALTRRINNLTGRTA